MLYIYIYIYIYNYYVHLFNNSSLHLSHLSNRKMSFVGIVLHRKTLAQNSFIIESVISTPPR